MIRRLDPRPGASIAKKMHEGVCPEVLARAYGVSVRKGYRCAQFIREIQIERGIRVSLGATIGGGSFYPNLSIGVEQHLALVCPIS